MALTSLDVLHPAERCLGTGTTPWQLGLLVDVGSTFTKVVVIDADGAVVGDAVSSTTIQDDVSVGVEAAVHRLDVDLPRTFDWALLCSSAAGGLRMASVGLTAALSGRAAELAALGSGAKVVATAHGFLTEEDVARIDAARPHLVLLSGGVDGGNEEALTHNARRLAHLQNPVGFVVAGNVRAAHGAERALAAATAEAGGAVTVVDNVYPRPGQINIDPTRDAVRELFMEHITRAKGLTELMSALKSDCEPTPLSVSRALGVIRGESVEPVALVDVGGATTDVHSSGGRSYRHRNVDIPLPELHRTVEGDIGMRWSAPSTVAHASVDELRLLERELGIDLAAEASARHRDPSFTPASEVDQKVDDFIARAAVGVALDRHCGHVVVRHRPWGDRHRVAGKDLRGCRMMVATGGIFRHTADPAALIHDAIQRLSPALAPRAPLVCVDVRYCAFAVGLTARLDEGLARIVADSVFPSQISEGAGRPR